MRRFDPQYEPRDFEYEFFNPKYELSNLRVGFLHLRNLLDFRERPEEGIVERRDQRLRVLVIDDDENARNAMARYAARQGTIVLGASTGLQGIAKAQTDRPDVILLDMMMPGVGGHEVLARLGADEATSKIPVIVVTSHFINDDERRRILSRASAVIYRRDLSCEAVTSAIDLALHR